MTTHFRQVAYCGQKSQPNMKVVRRWVSAVYFFQCNVSGGYTRVLDTLDIRYSIDYLSSNLLDSAALKIIRNFAYRQYEL